MLRDSDFRAADDAVITIEDIPPTDQADTPPPPPRLSVPLQVPDDTELDERGAVLEPKVLKGLGAGLDQTAIGAVKEVQFTPGRQRGKAVPVRMSIPIVFRLR